VRLAIIGIVLYLAAAPALATHPQTDVVTLDDGSTLMGEIKSVQYARLILNNDPAGTLNIEWRRITGMTSKFEYQVDLTGGELHYGTLETPDKPRHLKVVGSAGTIEVKLSDVVRLAPIEHTFWQRLSGSFNFGLTYTQTNDALQYNIGFDTSYRSRKNYGVLSGSSIFSSQNDVDSTQQSYLQLLLAQVNLGKWGPFELGSLESNPSQGYDLRTLLGGGATRFFIESSTRLLALNLGVVYNREQVTDSATVDTSTELLTGVAYRHYKRASNSPSVNISLVGFTDLSSDRRYRAVFKFTSAWDIIGNFTFNFTVNDTYDSSPPGVDADKNNLVVVTSIGYTF